VNCRPAVIHNPYLGQAMSCNKCMQTCCNALPHCCPAPNVCALAIFHIGMYHNTSIQLLHQNTLELVASALQAAPMSAAVSGSPSRSEQQQQSLEDAWSCQLALLRQQHTLFAMTSTNSIVSKLQQCAFSMTATAAAAASAA